MKQAEKKRFGLIVEYDGSDFVGWQFQSNGRSVQGVLEAALRALFFTDVRVHGAGRTDAGVHATGQVAHFDLVTTLDGNAMARAINAKLPPDVTVHTAKVTDRDLHSRFSASSRSYIYRIAHQRVSLARRTHWILRASLDHDAILATVPCLRGTHDFTAFSKNVPSMSHHYCHVFHAEWLPGESKTEFHIRSNRFLQGMVRCIVGGLVLVGRHRLSPDDFAALITSRDRSRAPMLAPAHGLALSEVGYDLDDRALIDRIILGLKEEGKAE